MANTNGTTPMMRNYQQEMYEESLKKNIIVAMDTGTGKTHVAIMRIQYELQNQESAEKLLWFLAPYIDLADQQRDFLEQYLPPESVQFITSNHGVDTWSTQQIWDQALSRPVIATTPQILYDALCHGFVNIHQISLLVFDEAHHCRSNHVYNRIMQEFYHPSRIEGINVPAILGLSASPIIKTETDLAVIEKNLDAIARTPLIHRETLMMHVHKPKSKMVDYNPDDDFIELLPPQTSQPKPLLSQQAPGISPFHSKRDQSPQKLSVPAKKKGNSWLDHLGDDLISSVIQPASKTLPFQPSTLHNTSNFTISSENDEYEVLMVETDEDATPTGPAASSETEPLIIQATSLEPLIQPNDDEYEKLNVDQSENFIPLTETSLQTISIRNRRSSPVFDSLLAAYETMDIMKDPYVVELENQNSSKLYKTISTKKTDSQRHMKQLVDNSRHVLEECGPWAVEWFISEVVTKFLSRDVSELKDFVAEFADEETGFWRTEAEMLYLRDCLQKIKLPKKKCDIKTHISAKVMKLIDVLLDEYKAETSREEFSGLVFVNQRVTVAAVAQIIREHPKTSEIFKVGTMVGSSNGRKGARLIQDVVSSKRNNSLVKFREGELNLLVATSVIQEGVDVPDCHLVTCFDLPKILVEYVQRRGRARRKASSFVLMYPVNQHHRMEEFEKMEKEMIKHYMDPSRELAPEDSPSAEIVDMRMNRTIRIPETGAMFNLGNVIPHLEHFCASLPQHEFVNTRPIYHAQKVIAPDGDPCWSASITLPNTVDSKIRRATSTQLWRTEKWAKQDAAFEAFKALYEHKLVNDNLMPLHKYFNVQEDMIFKRPPKMAVPERLDPWHLVDKKWDEGSLFLMDINVEFDSGENIGVQMLLPIEVPEIEDLPLYWTLDEKARVKFGSCQKVDDKEQSTIMERARKASYRLFKSMYSRKMHEDEKRYEFAYMFIPRPGEEWDESSPMQIEALEAVGKDNDDIGLVRDNNGTPYIFRRFRHELSILEAEDFKGSSSRNPESVKQDQPLLEVQKLSKRRDFLHPETLDRRNAREPKSLLFLPEFLFFDTLPWRYSQLALFVPFLVDRVGKAILAADLKQTLQFKGIPEHLIVQAVTASSARDPKDYQRLEFLGDSVLKVLTSIALVDEFPLYHEGYLSGLKDKVVSNTTLAEKSKENGMSKWINTAPFTALKWTPHYRHQDHSSTSTPKNLSTKVLADVVESLIGAAYLSSGFEAATEILKTFNLSSLQFPWHPLEHRITSLIATTSTNASQYPRQYPSYFSKLEKIIGYTFNNRNLLLEAITHVSYGGDSTNTCYQRLEFLGDSILDMVIVQKLYNFSGPALSQIQMHHLKSISVNAHLLAFLCLSTGTYIDQFELDPHLQKPILKSKWFPLHQFLRHHHTELALSQRLTLKRYHQLSHTIRRKLDQASEYPWEELHALDAPKHLSDMIESILGAIWIDSHGCFDTASSFVERIGVMDVLRRCMRDKVEANHPLSRFGIMAAEGGKMRRVRYEVEMLRVGEWECRLSVEGEVLVEEKGVSKAHVKTRAARRGLRVLREMDEAKTKEDEKKEEKEEKEEEEEEVGGKNETVNDFDEREEELIFGGRKSILWKDELRAAVEMSQLATLVRLDELQVDFDDVENCGELVVDKDEGVILGP